MDASELSRRMEDFYLVANETLRDVRDLTEPQVKHWIVSPFLVALGWDPRDKRQVFLDFPVGKDGAHADYALLDAQGHPRIIVDARRPGESSSEPEPAAGFAKTVGAPLALITNGQEFSLWQVTAGDPTPLLGLALKDLPANGETLLGLTADYRGSDSGIQLLRRIAIRQAVLQLLEDNSERSFDAIVDWVMAQVAPKGGLDDTTQQAVRDATLLWLTDEHHNLLPTGAEGGRIRHDDLRITAAKDWDPFPRGPPGTYQYRYDTAKTLDVRQTAREVRDAMRHQGLRTATATAFGGFYSALRSRAGLPAAIPPAR